MTRTRAADLAPGDTYKVGPEILTVTQPPYTTDGLLGDTVLRVPIRTQNGTETADVVHPDHTVKRT